MSDTGDRGPQIPWRKRIRLPSAAYSDRSAAFHLVARALADTSPFSAIAVGNATWKILLEDNSRGAVDLRAACLMPDHLHLVCVPRERSIVAWINAFKSLTTHRAKQAGWSGRLWQPSFWDRLLRDQDEYDRAVAYVLDNPSAAGLATDDQAWPWVFPRL